jgi:hypothetical protein
MRVSSGVDFVGSWDRRVIVLRIPTKKLQVIGFCSF